mmetsp:Transcript_8544/g.26495  ORF Transcript_8544/g.26495 Transcript_8544/m.26495 type:complete len:212 (+) Transcript_8544:1362-1997(+)
MRSRWWVGPLTSARAGRSLCTAHSKWLSMVAHRLVRSEGRAHRLWVSCFATCSCASAGSVIEPASLSSIGSHVHTPLSLLGYRGSSPQLQHSVSLRNFTEIPSLTSALSANAPCHDRTAPSPPLRLLVTPLSYSSPPVCWCCGFVRWRMPPLGSVCRRPSLARSCFATSSTRWPPLWSRAVRWRDQQARTHPMNPEAITQPWRCPIASRTA